MTRLSSFPGQRYAAPGLTPVGVYPQRFKRHIGNGRCIPRSSRDAFLVAFTDKSIPELDLSVWEIDGRQLFEVHQVAELFQTHLGEQGNWMKGLIEKHAKLQAALATLEMDKQSIIAKAKETSILARERYMKLQSAEAVVAELEAEMTELKMEMEGLRKDLQQAVLVAANEIEDRLEKAWDRDHKKEVLSLQGEVENALKSVKETKASSLEAVRSAESKVNDAVELAVDAVQTKTKAALDLSVTSTELARDSATRSAEAATSAVDQQKEAIKMVRSIQHRALEAEQSAANAHQESVALQEEVKQLRQSLEEAQQKLSEETMRANSAEQDAASRVLQLEEETRARLEAAERAFETLKQTERERAAALQLEANRLSEENSHLTGEVQGLRSELSSAEMAVAQSTSQVSAMEGTLNEKLNLLQEVRKEEEEQMQKLQETLKQSAQTDLAKLVGEKVDLRLQAAENLMRRSENQFESRVDALHRSVVSATNERDYWRTRAMEAEGKEKIAKRELERIARGEINDSSVKAYVHGRMSSRVGGSLRRQLLAKGTRGDGITGGETSQPINSNWIPSEEERGPWD